MRIYRYRIGRAVYYGRERAAGILERCVRPSPEKFELHRAGAEDMLSGVEVLTPALPTKIVCVGRNYRDHAAELGNVAPEDRPLLFLKPPSCLIPHGAPIVLPAGAERVDYEGEIAIVISRRCRNVSAASAYDYLLGVTAFNDVTERTWQKRDSQWTVAKGCDTFGPCGPCIDTTAAEALRLHEPRPLPLSVDTYVNGERRQHGDAAALSFDFAALISYISGHMTLEAGDLIATGTPAGVGPLSVGDEVVVELSCGVRLANAVAAASLA